MSSSSVTLESTLMMGQGYILGSKVARAWSWPLTST